MEINKTIWLAVYPLRPQTPPAAPLPLRFLFVLFVHLSVSIFRLGNMFDQLNWLNDWLPQLVEVA